jgi:MFS family permease
VTQGPDAEERLWTGPFVLCFVTNLCQGTAFNLFLHLPGYLHDLGANDVRIGLISSLTALAAVALRPPVGRAMDVRGRRPVILWGGALHALATALYLAVDRIGPLLYGVRVLHGFAEALLFSALFAYAADRVPARRRTEGLALFGVSGMLPVSLGGWIGDGLLPRHGFQALFALAAALALASFALSFRMPEARRPRFVPSAATGARAALRQRELRPLWLIGTVFSVALTAFFVFIKRFVDETGIGSVGLFFGAYTGAALALRLFLGWLPDRVGPKRVLAPALVALCAGFAVMSVAASERSLVAAGLLCGFGHGFTFPILFGLVVTRAPDENRGTTLALFTALFDFGVLVGGPLFGLVIERLGFSAMFATAGAAMALGTLGFFAWDARVGVRVRRG